MPAGRRLQRQNLYFCTRKQVPLVPASKAPMRESTLESFRLESTHISKACAVSCASAGESIRRHTSAYEYSYVRLECAMSCASAGESMRRHTSAYVSIRQAYVRLECAVSCASAGADDRRHPQFFFYWPHREVVRCAAPHRHPPMRIHRFSLCGLKSN